MRFGDFIKKNKSTAYLIGFEDGNVARNYDEALNEFGDYEIINYSYNPHVTIVNLEYPYKDDEVGAVKELYAFLFDRANDLFDELDKKTIIEIDPEEYKIVIGGA